MTKHHRLAFVLVLFALTACAQQPAPPSVTWEDLPPILKNIAPPTFPAREFLVTDFGAVGDGVTDCTEFFAKAIGTCHESEGGRVVVPAGVFLTGAIHLKSNVNLFVGKDATIRFSTDPTRYLPIVYTRWEGVECMNYSPLLYAFGQENIAVTGEGLLDGQGSPDHWWSWKGNAESGWNKGMPSQKEGRAKLLEMADKGVPVPERLLGEGGSCVRISFKRTNVRMFLCKE